MQHERGREEDSEEDPDASGNIAAAQGQLREEMARVAEVLVGERVATTLGT